MNCTCNVKQGRRLRTIGPVVALAVLVTPLLGAVLYLRFGGECSACDDAGAIAAPRQHANADWTRAAAFKLDGSGFATEELVGRPAVLYFWATWCPQCKVQRDVLNGLAGEWGDRVRIVALSVDDDASAVGRYLKSHPRLSHELFASPELLEQFHVEALPTLVLIDAGGQAKSVSEGPMDAGQLHRLVEPLLK